MPDGLDRGWGTNADRIYVWTDPVEGFGPAQGGPVVYGSLQWDDPNAAITVIQASFPPLGVDLHSTTMVGYGVSSARGRFVYDAASDGAVPKWPRECDASMTIAAIAERALDNIVTNDVGSVI